MLSKSNGFYCLTEARELRGMTVNDLAQATGLSRQTIYKYENGTQTPSAETQQLIISALGFPYTFFEYPKTSNDFSSRPIFFRDMKTNLATKRKMAYRWLQVLCNHVDYLQNYLELNPVNVPDFDYPDVLSMTDEEIDIAADNLRRFWGLRNGPISNVTQLLENNGFIILRKYLDADKMDACSIIKDGRPYILINTYKQTCSRDLMNLCHELGHVILHQGISIENLMDKTTFELIEHQAWRFAEAFLMPPSTFIFEVGYPTLSHFKTLKLRWRTSIAGMIKYCLDYGIIDKEKYQYFYREMARQGIRKAEPYDDTIAVEQSTVLLECEQLLIAEGIKSQWEMLDESELNDNDYCELIAAPKDYFGISNNKPRLRLV